MALPTITMIDELMSTGSWAKDKRAIVLSPEVANKTVNINFDVPLPPEWDQFIDMKNGELYYINKKTGKKINDDPRKLKTSNNSSTENSNNEDDGAPPGFSPPQLPKTPELRTPKPNITAFLVLVGCKKCMAYMMVVEEAKVCPRCSGPILHFDEVLLKAQVSI